MMVVLDIKHKSATSIGYTLSPIKYEFSDNNFMLKSSVPDEMKAKITIDDIRLGSNLTTIY